MTTEVLLGLDQGTRKVGGKKSQNLKRAGHTDTQKGEPEISCHVCWEQKGCGMGWWRNPLLFCSCLESGKCRRHLSTRIRKDRQTLY